MKYSKTIRDLLQNTSATLKITTGKTIPCKKGLQVTEEDVRSRSGLHLSHGNHLCEAVLWCFWYHRGDFVSLHNCSVLELPCTAFEKLLARYPAMKAIGVEHADLFVRMVNEIDCSDLFDSHYLYEKLLHRRLFSSTRGSKKPSSFGSLTTRNSTCSRVYHASYWHSRSMPGTSRFSPDE